MLGTAFPLGHGQRLVERVNFGPVSAVVEGLVVLVRRVEDMVS